MCQLQEIRERIVRASTSLQTLSLSPVLQQGLPEGSLGAHIVKCFAELGPFDPIKPYASYSVPDLIPSEDLRNTEEPLLAQSPYELPCLPSVPGDYAKECLYLFLIRLRTSDWSDSVCAYYHLFPHHLGAFALNQSSTESRLRSLWMNQTHFPTNPAEMSAGAQELKDMGEPFHGQGSQVGQTFGLAAVEKLLHDILDKADIDLGHNAANATTA